MSQAIDPVTGKAKLVKRAKLVLKHHAQWGPNDSKVGAKNLFHLAFVTVKTRVE